MKGRFSTLDIVAILPELRSKICGWRVNQVYDCDSKTYLFKLNKSLIQMKSDSDPINEEEENANKMFFIIESGLRMHTTDYDWPKSHTPNGFALKLRKHLKNKRIESINQIGIDRLVDIQFGSSQAAYHLIVELYDRGNLILTDCDYTILNILRWRKPMPVKGGEDQDTSNAAADKTETNNSKEKADSENLKVGQIYPLDASRKEEDLDVLHIDRIREILTSSTSVMENRKNKSKNKAKRDSKSQEISLKNLLNPMVVYGAGLLEDSLITHLGNDIDGRKCSISIPILEQDGRLDPERVEDIANKIHKALEFADAKFKLVKESTSSPGYIVQKRQQSQLNNNNQNNNAKDKDTNKESDLKQEYLTNIDFYPIKSCVELKIREDPTTLTFKEFESFDRAVDIYFCNMESQKIDSKALHAEKDARKRLENIKLDHQKRLDSLAKAQKEDEEKARLIECNCDKVENALLVIRSLIACQTSWSDIWETIKEAKAKKDPVACLITGVKFDRNEFTMCLENPYEESGSDNDDSQVDSESSSEDSDDDEKIKKKQNKSKTKKQTKSGKDDKSKHSKLVDIDISLSAYANARRYFDKRRFAVKKEQKTIDVSAKAFKNVERKAKEMLKEVVIKSNITKARKRYWFENFFWFISSDGYLVVAGRDAEQNELLVKRYMKSNDIYVHADLHGASSVIVKNVSNTEQVPPKTLTEAGTMAVCYSTAWEAKIATTSWWVYPNQVSKTAPAGEYLTLGAFIIRGKKNYLPLSTLVLGFGFLFRLEEESIEKRFKERLRREALMVKENKEFEDLRKRTITEVSEDNSEANEITLLEPTDARHRQDDDDNGGRDEDDKDDDDSDDDNAKGNKSIKDGDVATSDSTTIMDKNDNNNDDDDDLDNEDDDDDVDESKTGNKEYRLVDTLTGAPNQDDILSYAIPVCGPYSALQSYKFKVKVIPGTNKRGKAAKTCLSVFLFDKNASQRERDLLKSCKDQDFARNIPNKCKISAVNLKTIQKKKTKKSEVRFHNHQSIS